jgi:stage V sporulation protein D (sporulation-specific penicillin-binding protein)
VEEIVGLAEQLAPIQLVTAFSALVTDGRLRQPRAIRAVFDRRGELLVDNTETVEKGHVGIDDETLAILRDMLAKAAVKCELSKWQAMGKTGTAQVPRKDRRGYEHGAYLSSFMAAAPVHDPAVVVLVMVRKPTKHGYYGAVVAVPAVQAILEKTLTYLNAPPDKPAEASRLAMR